MKKKIVILGAGSMGIAIAMLLHKNGHDTILWSPFAEEAALLNEVHECPQRLPGVVLPEEIECTTDLAVALQDCETAVLAVPAQKVRETCVRIREVYTKANAKADLLLFICAKGIEESTCKLMNEVVCEELPDGKIAVLTGPSYAIEIAKGFPTALVCASEDDSIAVMGQEIFMNSNMRVYTNSDVIGAEVGGAIKNVIAFCVGICDGLGYENNTRAALITRGLAEITRLGLAMGAKQNTLAGLAGVGDLLLTCTGEYSRNRRAGILVGKGYTIKEAITEVDMVVEGVTTAKPAYQLAQKYGVDMPILQEANEIIFYNKKPEDVIKALMGRDKKSE